MEKALTKNEKIELRRNREIERWERQKARPKGRFYLVYIIFIITLIYAVDEIASQIGTLMKTEIANDLFNSESSVGLFDLLGMLVVPFQALGLLYRPLADKWGRKLFLVINTFGMSLALLVIFLSNNIALYMLGACLIQFFIPHDMHVVFIMESSPAKSRGIMYSCIKFIANMSVMLVPVLRRLLMETASEWRNVFLIPAIVGLVSSFVALLLARETDAFMDSRLRYLRLTDEEREQEKRAKSTENAQGGLIKALKFAWQHKQLKWLYITTALVNIGFIATINYQTIMTYGYAQHFVSSGMFSEIGQEVLDFVSTNSITTALFMFPVGCSVSQVVLGFVADTKGRKLAGIVVAANCLISFILFVVGSIFAWNPYLVGLFCGIFIGSYYSTNDVIIMMVGESAPTNLRSSIMSAQFIVGAIGYAISYIVSMPLVNVFGNTAYAIVSFCLLVPGFILGFITLLKKTKDTKGLDLDKVTGKEFD